ncbi:hypothetical protein IB276_17990 [Ensifer sp. ENS04]|uniref:hypothetical protein n=1 Tax=Ensifer sp. ENS04 TaxID=2769281 RepID=UPI001780A03B|nr:hypothetical protein [Ensifer sp. ENS04]MBD9541347.1 hypothetical protein [Ensifer sp. ENS04]
MRPQQRKFIVEFKSPRRRSAVRPASIWGDTDLKALAREAESDAPHLFEVAGPPTDLSSKQSTLELIEATPVDNVPFVAKAAAAAEVIVLSERAEEASSALEDVMPVTTVAPQPLKRPRKARVRPARQTTMDAPKQVAVDDLAVLEDENRRLKGLLLARLRQENAQLLKMLERFM